MSKRIWLILGVGLALIAVAFFVFKWENKIEPEPEPEPVKKPTAKEAAPPVMNVVSDLNASAGDDEQAT
jgi:hypothetical protein